MSNPEISGRARLIQKLESIATLSSDDKAALRALPMRLKEVKADSDIITEGTSPTECCAILEGFATRYKILPSGKRQIMSFHTPGDFIDFQSLLLSPLDHSVGALVPTIIGTVPHKTVQKLLNEHPRLQAAFWRDTLIDAAIFREWMVNLGQRTAYQRIAHLFCEMALRFQAVGMAEKNSFTLPVTQAELGDATGMSVVHVNRTLQELRRDKLIATHSPKIEVLDWPALKRAAGFNPNYLHQDRQKVKAWR